MAGLTQTKGATHRFVAVIYKVWILRCVSVPEEICRTLPQTRSVPVVATVAGRTMRTTVMAVRGGGYRLFLDAAIRKAAGVDAGDPVGVTLRVDRASREPIVPPDLARALRNAPAAKKEFEHATATLRREVVRYVEKKKGAETRARHIARCMEVLARRWEKRKRRMRGGKKSHHAQ
jgi:Bacteriocin-protection, YdeI or OmpD-Associated/Domain of unknown function (DUF1905)